MNSDSDSHQVHLDSLPKESERASASERSALLPAMPLKLFSVSGTTAIIDAAGNEVVGWMGFDDSNRTKAEHKALAAHIVQCVNAHDALLAACQAIVAWDAAESGAEPFDKDNGAGFYQRIAMCQHAMDSARAAIAKATAA